MLFLKDRFQSFFQPSLHKLPAFAPQLAPAWKIAFGSIELLPEKPAWQDGSFAFFASHPSAPSSANLIPVFSPSRRWVVIGTVWLCQPAPLAAQLGLTRKPESDLHLVAQLWERLGAEDALAPWQQFTGTFALAVYDRDRQTLTLGRDPAGVQTLYYTTDGATRWIAPRMRSLLPYHNRAIDEIALRDYLCCAFVPGDRTLWKGVRKLSPGATLRLPNDQIQPYWTLQERIVGEAESIEWHSQRLRHLLEETVKDALPNHEPVGCFLSGGIDSSCVTALACQLHNAPVHTFSIHFGEQYPNELEFSSLVAQHCQTHHHILQISLSDLWAFLPEAMAHLDNPIGDPLTVPNLLLGRLAKQFVNVVLNGEGGDPCFGGPKNQPMLIQSLYGRFNQQDAVQAYLISFQKCAVELPQLLKPEIWQAVRSEPYYFEGWLNSDLHYLNRLMAINIRFKGADHILTKVSNLTRAVGLEGRSPLFDPRMVDLSMQIPPEHKLSGIQEKAVLKQAVADLLPDVIVNRPKSGMMVPVQIGFQKHWQREARALLLNRKAAISPYLNHALIQDWLTYQGDTWRRYGVKLWLLASLESWLQVHQL
ncbi:Asparagine synthetase [glutamine-hydrolyzing] 1 [Leptolyngbya sp. O-77]|nr:Asparagine synthetase [glutamine-hydrolyzing] 1 [Leptolyngbya sp. O-77]